MHPDPPSDTWEPDPPFRWTGDIRDTDGIPAVGGSSDGPEPDANSGREPKRRNGNGIGNTAFTDWSYRLGMVVLGVSFFVVAIAVFFLGLWVVEQVARVLQ